MLKTIFPGFSCIFGWFLGLVFCLLIGVFVLTNSFLMIGLMFFVMSRMNDVAPCGIYCAGCKIYQASEDPELAEKIAENLDIGVEDAQCLGCRAENGEIPVISVEGKCRTYQCVKDRGLDFCYECEDFPCSKLYTCRKSPAPHNSKMTNLVLIEKKGQEWFSENAEKLTKLYYQGTKETGGSELELDS